MSVRIEIDDLGNILDQMVARLLTTSKEPALQQCAQELNQGFAQNFASKTDFAGNPWPPRKIAGDGHPLLIDEGDLLLAAASPGNSAHIEEIGDDELLIGAARTVAGKPKAAALQFGYPPRNLPPRPYIWGRSDAIDACGEILGDWGVDALEGRQ